MNYEKAKQLFDSAKNKETGKPIARSTRIVKIGADCYGIKFHETIVAQYHPNGSIVLNSGGWRTKTTKERINYALSIDWPYRIISDNGQWFLYSSSGYPKGDKICLFTDYLIVKANGDILGGLPVSSDNTKQIKKQCRKYAKDFIDSLFNGEIPAPGNGDCLYCHMRDATSRKPLGEATKDSIHIQSHIEESYFVPSLLVNAMERFGVSQCAQSVVVEIWKGIGQESLRKIDRRGGWYDIARNQLTKAVYRYCVSQLGIQA